MKRREARRVIDRLARETTFSRDELRECREDLRRRFPKMEDPHLDAVLERIVSMALTYRTSLSASVGSYADIITAKEQGWPTFARPRLTLIRGGAVQ